MRRRGDLAEALSTAAAEGPAQVTTLAARAHVGYGVARYTASRMVARGELVVLAAGRPAMLALPEPQERPAVAAQSPWGCLAAAA